MVPRNKKQQQILQNHGVAFKVEKAGIDCKDALPRLEIDRGGNVQLSKQAGSLLLLAVTLNSHMISLRSNSPLPERICVKIWASFCSPHKVTETTETP